MYPIAFRPSGGRSYSSPCLRLQHIEGGALAIYILPVTFPRRVPIYCWVNSQSFQSILVPGSSSQTSALQSNAPTIQLRCFSTDIRIFKRLFLVYVNHNFLYFQQPGPEIIKLFLLNSAGRKMCPANKCQIANNCKLFLHENFSANE